MFRRGRRQSAPGDLNASKKKGRDGSSSGKRNPSIKRSNSAPSRKLPGVLKYVSADDSLHSTYGSQTRKSTAERISFANIEIREYARTIGDNPSCSSGPPISISWEYAPATVLTVETYEETRPPRRSNIEMILPRDLRQRMLRKEWDVTQSQIASAVRTNIKIKNQRRTTVNNLGKSSKMEEAMENAGKGLSGVFGRSTDKKVMQLEEQMKAAENARKQRLLQDQMAGEDVPTEDTAETDP